MHNIKFISDKKLDAWEESKLLVKYTKIIKDSKRIYPDLSINLNHDYIDITIHFLGEIPFQAYDVKITFQWLITEKELYLKHDSYELIRSFLNKFDPAYYNLPSWYLIEYIYNHQLKTHRFYNLSAAFEFIGLYRDILMIDIERISQNVK